LAITSENARGSDPRRLPAPPGPEVVLSCEVPFEQGPENGRGTGASRPVPRRRYPGGAGRSSPTIIVSPPLPGASTGRGSPTEEVSCSSGIPATSSPATVSGCSRVGVRLTGWCEEGQVILQKGESASYTPIRSPTIRAEVVGLRQRPPGRAGAGGSRRVARARFSRAAWLLAAARPLQ
jgi:hypothetical protein